MLKLCEGLVFCDNNGAVRNRYLNTHFAWLDWDIVCLYPWSVYITYCKHKIYNWVFFSKLPKLSFLYNKDYVLIEFGFSIYNISLPSAKLYSHTQLPSTTPIYVDLASFSSALIGFCSVSSIKSLFLALVLTIELPFLIIYLSTSMRLSTNQSTESKWCMKH